MAHGHHPGTASRRRAERWLQAGVLALLALGLWALLENIAAAMAARGIRAGFDFLWQPAGFAIGEGPLPFEAADAYWRAFLAGLLNTARLALPAVALALLIGAAIGLGRLSANLPLRSLCAAYVELLRNLPLLPQLLAWYFVLTAWLPDGSEPLSLGGGLWLSKNGLALPWWVDGGWQWPEPGPFTVSGGAALTPEYLAMLIGLALYTAAYIAETVRAGVRALPPGQRQAALALGMSPAQAFRLVLWPQALRGILPPLTNQALNLSKNASLAVVIGYPDLVSVANTTLNQTGRAAECIAIIVAVYLLLSALTAALSRTLERRTARWATPA